MPGNLPSSEELEAIRRILEHGFKLTRFVPLFLNPAQLYMILTTEIPSNDMVLESFLSCFSNRDANILKQAIVKDVFDNELKEDLINLLASYDIRGLPEPSGFLGLLHDLAKIEIIMKPYFFLKHISRKVWPANERIFRERLKKALKPNGQKLLKSITHEDNGNPHEKRVLDYLKRFVVGLNDVRASILSSCASSLVWRLWTKIQESR